MDDKINISSVPAEEAIARMREYRDKMNERLVLIHEDIKKMPETWSGNVGDENYEILMKYATKFEQITAKIDSFIDYLEKTKNAYKAADFEIDKRAEDNAGVSAI